jgi:hypothetical protein
MRFTLVFVFLTAMSLSASAQWYNVLKKHQRLPLVAIPANNSVARLKIPVIKPAKIPVFHPEVTDYHLEACEKQVMKLAQHNMSWRIYDQASYNFSDLAKLYIQQKRLSEAKWYLLQSTTLAQRVNDDRHTVANLMDLALVKSQLGETTLAQQDLAQACDLATAHNWNDNVAGIEKELKFIELNKTAAKVTLRYADDAIITVKKGDKAPVAN